MAKIMNLDDIRYVRILRIFKAVKMKYDHHIWSTYIKVLLSRFSEMFIVSPNRKTIRWRFWWKSLVTSFIVWEGTKIKSHCADCKIAWWPVSKNDWISILLSTVSIILSHICNSYPHCMTSGSNAWPFMHQRRAVNLACYMCFMASPYFYCKPRQWTHQCYVTIHIACNKNMHRISTVTDISIYWLRLQYPIAANALANSRYTVRSVRTFTQARLQIDGAGM